MASARAPSVLDEWLMIARFHIVLIAMTACVTFGYLFTGRYPFALVPVVAVDWFVINLVNRVTDLEEDLRNGIPGTERVARRKRTFTAAAWGLLVGSFVVTHLLWPELTPARVAVQLIGLGYNYRIVPTPKGWSRFKELYFFKNFMSAVLFVLTCFVYPLLAGSPSWVVPVDAVVLLAVFFVPFELTYEILYDFRDLEGDRAEGVPTYPVVHGPVVARRILEGLLLFAALVLLGGFLAGALGVRELLMLAAPAVQLALYRARLPRGLTSPDCVFITHVGTALLVLFLVGTALWTRAGLPPNIFL